MRCANCQNEVPSYASVCPFCGELVQGKGKGLDKELERKLSRAVEKLGGKGNGEADGVGTGVGKVFTVSKEAAAAPAPPSSAPSATLPKVVAAKTASATSSSVAKPRPDLIPARYFPALLASLVALVVLGGGAFAWYQGLFSWSAAGPGAGVAPVATEAPAKPSLYEQLPADTVAWLEYDWAKDRDGQTRRDLTGALPALLGQLPGNIDWEPLVADLQIDAAAAIGSEMVLALNQKMQAGLVFSWLDPKAGSVALKRIHDRLQKFGWRAALQEPGPGPSGQWPGEPVVLELGRVIEPASRADNAKKEERIAFAYNDQRGSISTDPFYAKELAMLSAAPSTAFPQLRKQLNEHLNSQQPLRAYLRPNLLADLAPVLLGGGAGSNPGEQPAGQLVDFQSMLTAWSGVAVEWSGGATPSLHSIALPATSSAGQAALPLKRQPRYKATLSSVIPANTPVVVSTSGLGLEALLEAIFQLYQPEGFQVNLKGSINLEVASDADAGADLGLSDSADSSATTTPTSAPAIAPPSTWSKIAATLQSQGVELAKDILGQLSQETVVAAVPGTVDDALFGYAPVLLARVNATALQPKLRALENAIGSMYREAMPGNYVVQEKANADGTVGFEWLPLSEASHFAEQAYHGTPIRYFAFDQKVPDYLGPAIGFYYSLKDDLFIVADNMAAIQLVIDTQQKTKESLAANPAFVRAQASLPGQLYGYAYVDMTAITGLLQSILGGFLPPNWSAEQTAATLNGALLIYEAGERDAFDTTFKWLPAEMAAEVPVARPEGDLDQRQE